MSNIVVGKVAVRHILSLKGTDAFSDAISGLVGSYSLTVIGKSLGLGTRQIDRNLHAAKIRAPLREVGCPLIESVGVTPYLLVKVGDAAAVAAAVANGESLRAALETVGGTPFGLFEKPADVFAAALKEAGDPLPPAFQLLTLAAETLCFDTAIADLERGGACIQDVIFALGQIEAHLLSLLSEPAVNELTVLTEPAIELTETAEATSRLIRRH